METLIGIADERKNHDDGASVQDFWDRLPVVVARNAAIRGFDRQAHESVLEADNHDHHGAADDQPPWEQVGCERVYDEIHQEQQAEVDLP